MTSSRRPLYLQRSPDDRYPTFSNREQLSITVPPPDIPIEVSRFSPESPPLPPLPARRRSVSTWTNTIMTGGLTPKSKDIEANVPQSPRSVTTTGTRIRDRFTKIFFDVRTLMRDRDAELVPIQPPQLQPWPPLHIDKKICCADCLCHQKKKRSRRDRFLLWVLVIIILCLLGDVIFLNIHVLVKSSNSPTTPTNTTTSSSKTLSADAQECLSEYNVNAPSNPSGYPCSSCLPVLQGVSSSFSDGNATDAQQIQNAIQFCGLRAFFDSMDSNGQSALKNGEWVTDVKFCAWSGVSCDSTGKVGALTLTFPSVPSSIPNETGALSGLTSLHVIGNGQIPGGSLPDSFSSLKATTLLHLESTGISVLPDNLFSSLNQVTTLELIKNSQMGNNLPSSLTSLSLQNLVINNQNLNNPLQALSSSSSLQKSLQLLDLSSTSLSGTIPGSISSFSSLVELHLDSNNLSLPLPAAFPSNLGSLTMTNNSGLSGSVQGSFCSLSKLQTCSMSGTGLTAAGSCSVCKFS
ncbi:hypothetical protein QCA50_005281 [Cerrena zonata]|uniref:L domain-like protein n=1 Tax=Cerrena zonata TaxID=2478898 RepID=A0AAW0GJ50_9APHY